MRSPDKRLLLRDEARRGEVPMEGRSLDRAGFGAFVAQDCRRA